MIKLRAIWANTASGLVFADLATTAMGNAIPMFTAEQFSQMSAQQKAQVLAWIRQIANTGDVGNYA